MRISAGGGGMANMASGTPGINLRALPFRLRVTSISWEILCRRAQDHAPSISWEIRYRFRFRRDHFAPSFGYASGNACQPPRVCAHTNIDTYTDTDTDTYTYTRVHRYGAPTDRATRVTFMDGRRDRGATGDAPLGGPPRGFPLERPGYRRWLAYQHRRLWGRRDRHRRACGLQWGGGRVRHVGNYRPGGSGALHRSARLRPTLSARGLSAQFASHVARYLATGLVACLAALYLHARTGWATHRGTV